MADASQLARGLGDTIVAVSSPPGASERGVLRLSGDRAVAVVEPYFAPRALNANLAGMRRGALTGKFLLGISGVSIDVMLLVMRAPQSFTAEDVVEIHLIGAPVLLRMVSELLVRAGARPAEPGEFTRRAFLNGRLDLTQAEAVASLIHAESEAERRAALTVLDGGIRKRCDALSAELVSILAQLELSLDFSDQDIEILDPVGLEADLRQQLASIDELLEQGEVRMRGAERPRILLCGPANAGKSSLFNALSGENFALVSEQRGTTRDFLETEIVLGARHCVLLDTAGDDFEAGSSDREAHRLRRREMEKADLLLRVQDGRRPSRAADFERPHLDVFSRADVVASDDRAEGIWVDARDGASLDDLKKAILDHLSPESDASRGSMLILGERQRRLLTRVREALERTLESYAESAGTEILAAELHEALAVLRELSGEDYDDQVLDRIMRDFCIGK